MVSGTPESNESDQVGINTDGGSDNNFSLLTLFAWVSGRTNGFQSVDQGIHRCGRQVVGGKRPQKRQLIQG